MPPIEDLIAAIAAASEDELEEILRGLLSQVGQGMATRLGEIFVQVSRETIPAETGRTLTIETLTGGHSRAAFLGRTKAGNDVPYGEFDQTFGTLVAEEEAIYADKFIDDILAGKYTREDGTINVEAIEARADFYEVRLRGTANEAWANTLDPEDLVYWLLGNNENHCGTCEDLNNNSPYRPADLPVHPGDNATECSLGCDCTLRSESGKTGF